MLSRLALKMSLIAGLLMVPLLIPSAVAREEEKDPILSFVKPRLKHPDKPFTLIVSVKVKDGAGAKFEAAFVKAVKGTRAEKGCLTYELNRDSDDTVRYLVYERWKSLADLEAHLKTDYIKTLLATLPELVAGPPEPRVLVPAGE